MAEFAPEMPVKSALVPIGAESVRRCSSVPPMREGAHFGAGLIHPGQADSRGSASSLASFVPIPQKSDISPIQGATSLYTRRLDREEKNGECDLVVT